MPNPKRLKCIVKDVSHFDGMVSHVSLKPEGRIPRFIPGQFLHFTLGPYDPISGFWPESRVFSIASPPGREVIDIVYAVKGKYTLRMWEEIDIGKEVWIKLPYGSFFISKDSNLDVVFIAGGTGVSPFISYLSYVLLEPRRINLTLVYGVRKPELVLFGELFNLAIRKLNGFRLFLSVEERSEELKDFNASPGRLDLSIINRAAKLYPKPIYYISGPPMMINVFRKGINELGVESNRINVDEWQ